MDQPAPRSRPAPDELELIDAADRGDVEAVEALIARGVSPAARDGAGRSALMRAAGAGRARIVELLIPLVDPAELSDAGESALGWAANGGHPDCVELLAPFGPPDSALPARGRTPLMVAIDCGDEACVEILLPRSDLSVVGVFGRDALGTARARGSERVADMVRAEIARREAEGLAAELPARAGPRAAAKSL